MSRPLRVSLSFAAGPTVRHTVRRTPVGCGSGSSGSAPSLPHNEPDDPEKSDRPTAIINPPPEASQFRKKKKKALTCLTLPDLLLAFDTIDQSTRNSFFTWLSDHHRVQLLPL